MDVPVERVVERGRLGPGDMIAVDTVRGRVMRNEQIKEELAARRPYQVRGDGTHAVASRRSGFTCIPVSVHASAVFALLPFALYFFVFVRAHARPRCPRSCSHTPTHTHTHTHIHAIKHVRHAPLSPSQAWLERSINHVASTRLGLGQIMSYSTLMKVLGPYEAAAHTGE